MKYFDVDLYVTDELCRSAFDKLIADFDSISSSFWDYYRSNYNLDALRQAYNTPFFYPIVEYDFRSRRVEVVEETVYEFSNYLRLFLYDKLLDCEAHCPELSKGDADI